MILNVLDIDGPEHVALCSGVPVTQFRMLTVIVQLASGNRVSSGKGVLIGRITRQGSELGGKSARIVRRFAQS